MANQFEPGETEKPEVDESEHDASAGASMPDSLSDDEILERARTFMSEAAEAESSMRKDALEDIEFSIGKQWHDNIRQDRDRDGRPCLVINRMPQFIQQITNDQRQNRPAIKVHPVNNGANEDTAKVIQGIVRHIEFNSNAEIAYDTAFDAAARGGFGYWRVVTAYASPESFDQEIFIKRIRNQFSVFFDPNSQEPDGSDANEAGIAEYFSKERYQAEYPKSRLSSSGGWDQIGNLPPVWMRDGAACVVEYFYKSYRDATLYLLNTGESVLDEKLQAKLAEGAQSGVELKVVGERKTQIPFINWIKTNGIEILDRTKWLGKYIPIVPVYGSEVYVDGRRELAGLVRNAKDPQRMLNYWKSAQTEAIALAPRAPFIGAEGQFEGREQEWASANRRNHAYLQYKPVSIGGQPAPPPQRQAFEPAVQAITQAAMQSADDLKATTGIYDPSLGAGPADTSGVAIQRRNMQAQTANFHFVDNLSRSMRHTGRILVDLIPKIYDTARAIRIIGEDDAQKVVQINQPFKDESGKETLYDLDAGLYDVTIDVGPSYASKRQEAAASMQSLAQSLPNVMQVAADLFVKNMDWPGAQEIAERLRRTIPPQVLNDPAKGQPAIPPQAMAQMEQMGQMIDQLTKELGQMAQERETKRAELESRERIAFAQMQTDAEIALAKIGSQEAMSLLQQEVSAITQRLKLIGFGDPMNPSSQSLMPPGPGGQPTDGAGQASQPPTGGESPGQPMEQ